jgi:hypothetical protein
MIYNINKQQLLEESNIFNNINDNILMGSIFKILPKKYHNMLKFSIFNHKNFLQSFYNGASTYFFFENKSILEYIPLGQSNGSDYLIYDINKNRLINVFHDESKEYIIKTSEDLLDGSDEICINIKTNINTKKELENKIQALSKDSGLYVLDWSWKDYEKDNNRYIIILHNNIDIMLEKFSNKKFRKILEYKIIT